MRVIVVGTSAFTLALARGALDAGADLAGLVTLSKTLLPDNSLDIVSEAATLGVPGFEISDINAAESISLLKSLEPDFILSSWPKLLSAEALSVPKRFVIGSHPTALPANRGRHPLHWLIVLGLSESALSFFRMDAGIDTGNILHSVPFEILETDTVSDLVEKMIDAGYQGVFDLLRRLAADTTFAGRSQAGLESNYWRARTPHDVTLDFRMSAEHLGRLARSFGEPYPCAKLFFEKHCIRIADVSLARTLLPEANIQRMEPGRIVSCTAEALVVKAADTLVECRALDALPQELRKAKHVFPPTYYVSKWGSEIFFPQ